MERLEILKTYKIFIGGQFPRTESGRYYTPLDKKGQPLANMCLSSRKDFRNAVVAARKAFGSWSERAAFNRGQILYRIAEMLEGRKAQFVEELVKQGSTKAKAKQEVELSTDRCVYYAGWCDKYQQIFSSVNPVASSHFNFSALEPMGVVGIIAPQTNGLIGLVSTILPAIAGGNTCVVLASENSPLCAITFAEVLATSDLPGGVVNILTGTEKELVDQFHSHMDVNAVVYSGGNAEHAKVIETGADCNVKRIFIYEQDFFKETAESPYYLTDLQELKTTWHPIEQIGGATGSY
ncbi:aldehyde dehydrogenase family protein [Fluviicola sp.]|jgi:acyl-CoA reductase-like NAD-dependent aldehyde dehydrogenase|uniref:aldehyde dehydrogenase family protein n=1 Tax=Fluviicola sp. TaxID=1917219 RepID=UPI0028268B48|nr:aldehyde dehydrogenase family protein [Fluviicola sp.]MDR0801421.1 aldehyde dehydrogenase family protein [Fluviicola sp.]